MTSRKKNFFSQTRSSLRLAGEKPAETLHAFLHLQQIVFHDLSWCILRSRRSSQPAYSGLPANDCNPLDCAIFILFFFAYAVSQAGYLAIHAVTSQGGITVNCMQLRDSLWCVQIFSNINSQYWRCCNCTFCIESFIYFDIKAKALTSNISKIFQNFSRMLQAVKVLLSFWWSVLWINVAWQHNNNCSNSETSVLHFGLSFAHRTDVVLWRWYEWIPVMCIISSGLS